MNRQLLQNAVQKLKDDLELSIRTASFDGSNYDNGQKAKEALIRSQRLILIIHEVAKSSLTKKLKTLSVEFTVFPPVGQSSPELPIAGFLKAKRQDIVVLFSDRKSEVVKDGLLTGTTDVVGKKTSEQSIVVGVRSQLSSVDKNFDTLMERAFAETLNLRLRLPSLVMGEVYLLPVYEYNDQDMLSNRVKFKSRPVKVEKYIKTFLAISNRPATNIDGYKYNKTALVFVDFTGEKAKIIQSATELLERNLVSTSLLDDLKEMRRQGMVSFDDADFFASLSPFKFSDELLKAHRHIHPNPYK